MVVAKTFEAPRAAPPRVVQCMCAALVFFSYCVALGFAARTFLMVFAPTFTHLPGAG